MRFVSTAVSLVGLVGLIGTLGCAGSPAQPPRSPAEAPDGATDPSASAATGASDPFAIAGPLTEEAARPLPTTPPDLAAWAQLASRASAKAPASCAVFTASAPPSKAACDEAPAARGALDAALHEGDPKTRDRALAALEGCTGLPAGLVRALRGDLAPPECADAIVEPVLRKPPADVPAPILHTMVGLSLAARLDRTVGKPPALAGTPTKDRVKAYVEGPFKAWVTEQARLVEELSVLGAKLGSYGRAIAAMHAGMADLRFVERAREAPVPVEYEKDAELRDVYFGTLDAMLEPRKARGRDAVLFALREYAALGALSDARVARGRALLGQLYAGRRVDVLDGLALPPLPPLAPKTPEERLAAQLPTFYTSVLLTPAALTSPETMRALVHAGIPAPARAELDREGSRGALAPEVRAAYARARLDLGRLYWRRVDFDRAAALSQHAGRTPEETLVLALALALRRGPDGAGAMMLAESPAALDLRHVEALDAVARSSDALAGHAAFDAALLLATSAPSGAEAAPYFRDVAARFRQAATRLSDPELARSANARAEEADATTAAMQ